MPAIHPGRLKESISNLMDLFDQPAEFKRGLHQLLSFYADRTYRPGQSGEPSPLIEAYKVRPPVMRQLKVSMMDMAAGNPAAAIALCDALWEEPYLEFRQLASLLLGSIPSLPVSSVLDRIREWLRDESDPQIIDSVFNDGMDGIDSQDLLQILTMAEEYINDPNTQKQRLGVRALLSLVGDLGYENLPQVYKIIQRLSLQTHSEYQTDMIDLVTALAIRSPNETAYFLRQNLFHPESKDTAWLIRQCIKVFPTELQITLRDDIRGRK
jgi:hypothetical protein